MSPIRERARPVANHVPRAGQGLGIPSVNHARRTSIVAGFVRSSILRRPAPTAIQSRTAHTPPMTNRPFIRGPPLSFSPQPSAQPQDPADVGGGCESEPLDGVPEVGPFREIQGCSWDGLDPIRGIAQLKVDGKKWIGHLRLDPFHIEHSPLPKRSLSGPRRIVGQKRPARFFLPRENHPFYFNNALRGVGPPARGRAVLERDPPSIHEDGTASVLELERRDVEDAHFVRGVEPTASRGLPVEKGGSVRQISAKLERRLGQAGLDPRVVCPTFRKPVELPDPQPNADSSQKEDDSGEDSCAGVAHRRLSEGAARVRSRISVANARARAEAKPK